MKVVLLLNNLSIKISFYKSHNGFLAQSHPLICFQINCAVILRDGAALTENDLTAYCKKNLASFKVPKKIYITDSLPRTATGKIQRRIVAQHFVEHTANGLGR
jgi:acyl-coenzyme A synthetase/AMP-(fatty) acid ligase